MEGTAIIFDENVIPDTYIGEIMNSEQKGEGGGGNFFLAAPPPPPWIRAWWGGGGVLHTENAVYIIVCK